MDKKAFEEAISILRIFTRETMLQYEEVRTGGECNMFDFSCVQDVANTNNCYDLASLSREEYDLILQHYEVLMEYFMVSRPEEKTGSLVNNFGGNRLPKN